MENNELIIKFAQKKNAVMAAIKYIQKTGRNEHQNYNYAKDEEILKHIREALLEVGLTFSAEAIGFEITHEIPTRSGSMRHIKIDLVCGLTDTETGYAEHCKWLGAAADSGDKALYKAFTSGIKYFLMKTFLLPTGDDVEADEQVDKDTQGKAKAETTRPKPSVAKKPSLTPKAIFWEAFKARCKRYNVAVPRDKNVIKMAIMDLCGTKETQDMTTIMGQQELPMSTDPPESKSWDIMTKVVNDYNIKPLIARARVNAGKIKKVS